MNSTTAKPGFHVGRDLLLGGGEVIIYEIYGKFMPNNGNVADSTREKALTMPSHPEWFAYSQNRELISGGI